MKSLEDYEERFQLSYKRARCTFDPESLKLVLLSGLREDLLDTLHLFMGRDIYQLPYEDIKTVFRNHSRELGKRVRVVNLWSVHRLPTHPSRVKLETC